jgi:hypothetical protein
LESDIPRSFFIEICEMPGYQGLEGAAKNRAFSHTFQFLPSQALVQKLDVTPVGIQLSLTALASTQRRSPNR